jgi:hypothetical protein
MKVRRFARQFPYPTIALALMSAGPLPALAQDSHSLMPTSQTNELTPDQKSNASALLKKVREATERFQNVEVAEGSKYELLFGCVSGDSAGAMGLHYVSMPLLQSVNQSGVMDVDHPQIVIYEPTADGGLRLTGADYLVYADAWDKIHPHDPPQLMGQLFHLFDAPNRFGLPAFYSLHVWAWKDNPNGAFVNWHPNVSCEPFTGKDDPDPRR